MSKLRTYLLAIALAAGLCACGGSDGAFQGSSSGASSGGTGTVASITLETTSPQLASNGQNPPTITAIVKNSGNAVITGQAVTFSTDSGVITPTQTLAAGSVAGVTDSNGEAAAVLSTPGDPANRNITVTATVGAISSSLTIAVVGTKLSVSGPASLILNSSGSYSVSLADSGGGPIAGATVTLTSSKGNTLTPASLTTNANGQANFTVQATNSGGDTITATALGMTATTAVNVSSQSFNITAPAANSQMTLNTPQTVTAVWTNNGSPVAGQPVTFATTRGSFGGNPTTTVNTDGTGTATASLMSATGGPATISATGSGVSAQTTAQFIATNPATIEVQASPTSVKTSGTSTITAIVWDAQQNLVQGQTVDFQLTDKTGGSLSVASAVTDAQGRAQTVYTATGTPSAANGVTITATVQGTAINGTVALTVGGQTVFLSLGTGNKISEQNNNTQFVMPYSVIALDASGNAVSNVNITLTVHSFPYAKVPPADLGANGSTLSQYAAYSKGFWSVCGSQWCQNISASCFNEDVDGSGILKSPSEDINGNGKLDPGDVAVVSPGSVTTDATGSATFNVVYPEDHAEWVQVLLTASATVSGTETSTSEQFVLPILASYVTSTQASPPGQVSPYGVANACNDPN